MLAWNLHGHDVFTQCQLAFNAFEVTGLHLLVWSRICLVQGNESVKKDC